MKRMPLIRFLDLFAHLLDHSFSPSPPGDREIDRLGAQCVGLAVEFLHQESSPCRQRRPRRDVAQFRDVCAEPRCSSSTSCGWEQRNLLADALVGAIDHRLLEPRREFVPESARTCGMRGGPRRGALPSLLRVRVSAPSLLAFAPRVPTNSSSAVCMSARQALSLPPAHLFRSQHSRPAQDIGYAHGRASGKASLRAHPRNQLPQQLALSSGKRRVPRPRRA